MSSETTKKVYIIYLQGTDLGTGDYLGINTEDVSIVQAGMRPIQIAPYAITSDRRMMKVFLSLHKKKRFYVLKKYFTPWDYEAFLSENWTKILDYTNLITIFDKHQKIESGKISIPVTYREFRECISFKDNYLKNKLLKMLAEDTSETVWKFMRNKITNFSLYQSLVYLLISDGGTPITNTCSMDISEYKYDFWEIYTTLFSNILNPKIGGRIK